MVECLISAIITVSVLVSQCVSATSVTSYFNVINAKRSDGQQARKYCIIEYASDANHSSSGHQRGVYYDLVMADGLNACVANRSTTDFNNSYVMVKYSDDCDINDQINYFDDKRVSGLLFSITCEIDIQKSINITSDALRDRFSVSLIADSSVESMVSFGADRVKLFENNGNNESLVRIDFSMIIIWFLATFTVVLGAYWSGLVRLSIFRQNNQPKDVNASAIESKESCEQKAPEEEPFLNISPVWVLLFVVGMALMLLALYFFYKYLVYIIIGLFTIASMASVFACGEPILFRLLPNCLTKPSFKMISDKFGRLHYFQLGLLMFAIAVSLTWFALRKESYSWSMQDILGVCFSLNMLRTIRLPSFKICFVLLSLLFFYDIFFVFITPLFTSKGNSVMVDVATGGATNSRCGKPGEQLPMVFRVPHLLFRGDTDDPLDICFPNRDSILGFGDILVPGLLVSYCHAFDLIFEVKYRIYYVTTCVCYGIGLIVTFAGLYLMDGNAQPALLYLVPFTIIPPLLIAWYRKELRQLWDGPESHFSCGSRNVPIGSAEDNREDNLLIEGNQMTASDVRQTHSNGL